MTLKDAKEIAKRKFAYGGYMVATSGPEANRPYTLCPCCNQTVSTITNTHLKEKNHQAIRRRLIEHLRADCEKD